MSLSEFIKSHLERIIHEWEDFASTLPAAKGMNRTELRDHVKGILNFIARDINAPQTSFQQSKKSKGLGPKEGGIHESAAQIHSKQRSESGFDMIQMASEYRALRASVIKLWTVEWDKVEPENISDLIRFNEAIDQALMESITSFKEKIDSSKDMFIGILSHDLRNPLNAIGASCELLLAKNYLNEEQVTLATQIQTSTERINKMITDLLDLTRIKLGEGIAMKPASADIGIILTQVINEIQASNPERDIIFRRKGTLQSVLDSDRISQVFSNLISNAVKYSRENSPISITGTGKPNEIIIEFHNEGNPIPPDRINTIFDSFTRIVKKDNKKEVTEGLGLGLYIAKEIVTAHGGNINVTSSEKEGTTFTIRLPQKIKLHS